MTTLRAEREIAAGASVVWALLEDFQHIDAFNPNLSRSAHIDGTPLEGVGAERRCELKDGRNWIEERVVDWRPGERYTVEIYAGTMPIRDVRTTLAVSPNGAVSRAVMQITYTPKFGPVGQLLDLLLLRRKTKGLMDSVLEGLEQKSVESSGRAHATASASNRPRGMSAPSVGWPLRNCLFQARQIPVSIKRRASQM